MRVWSLCDDLPCISMPPLHKHLLVALKSYPVILHGLVYRL